MIPIKREPADFYGTPPKRCAFCRQQTRYWHMPTGVAVCRDCAKKHEVREVPTKAEWCEKEWERTG